MRLTYLVDRLKSEKAYIFGVSVPLYYVLLFLMIFGVFYGLRSWMNRDKWVTLVHEQYNFSVDYPVNWTQNTFGERGSKTCMTRRLIFGQMYSGNLVQQAKLLEFFGLLWKTQLRDN